MPEVLVDVRWPDGSQEWLYSPSTVVEEVFSRGEAYPLADFVELTRTAMTEASDRVRARFGFPCSRAAATLASVEATAARLGGGTAGGAVRVVAFRR
jgi:uncharacterized repeat protein (TIGR04042 family)